MFIPFIFTLTPEDDLRYLWIFYKYLDFAKKFKWPMISQAKYYEDPDKYKDMGRSEVSELTDIFKYERPTKHDIDLIQKYMIPDYLFDKLMEELGSQSDAWMFIIKNQYDPLEKCLRDIFNEIISKNPNEKIEGILTFASVPSLLYLCKELNIPVIHNEIGPLRNPSYRLTAYLDFKGLFGDSELEDRYNKFYSEKQAASCPILNRKEIVSLFLDYKSMYAINLLDSEPVFEMGIATQYAVDFSILNYSLNNNLDLILMAKKNYDENELILRMHPGDTSFSKYRIVKNIDTSDSSMEFVAKSRRVASISSNVAFEAMLWGRTAYTTGKCAYSFKAKKNLSDKQENIVDIEFVNFVVFAYLIPYELMTDENYLRWRITYPSEKEIYNYHLEYYLSSRGIDKKQLALPADQRLYAFLESQGFDAAGEVLQNGGNNKRLISILNEVEKISDQNKQVKYLFTNIYHLMKVNQKFQKDLKNNNNEIERLNERVEALLTYVSQLERTVKDAHATLVQRDENIVALSRYIFQLEDTVKGAHATLTQRDEQVGALSAYVSQLEGTVKDAHATLAQRDERIDAFLAYVSQLENINKDMHTTLIQRDERIDAFLVYVAQLENQLNKIKSTTVYKMLLKRKFKE